MLETRYLSRDLFALGLLTGALFLGVALATYHPADPVFSFYSLTDQPTYATLPAPEAIHNTGGRFGALVAHVLLSAFGYGAHYMLFSSVALAAWLLARKRITEPGQRIVGWALTLLGFCALAALAAPAWTTLPMIGPGGYLGAAGKAILVEHFASAGAYLLALSVFLCGMLLCTEYAMVRMAYWSLVAPSLGISRRVRRPRVTAIDAMTGAPTEPVVKRKKIAIHAEHALLTESAHEAPVDEDAEEEEEDVAPAIRIAGKSNKPAEKTPPKNEAAPTPKLAPKAKPLEKTPAAAVKTPEVEAPAPAVATKHSPQAPPEPAGPRIKGPTPKDERQKVRDELEAASQQEDRFEYLLPSLDLLEESEDIVGDEQEKEVRRKAKLLEKTFANFGFNVRVVEIETGPVIAQYEVELEAGLRLSRITGLAEDLAIALRVPSVRIVAPIPGKNTVGIEVPNEQRQLVRLREVIEETGVQAKKMKIPIYLGKDVAGNPMVCDLASLPHLLIAGRTGTGKSVCLNTIIVSMLMTRRPDEVKMLMIDPKMVELSPYKTLPHLMHPVVTDMKKAEAILAWAVDKMEERYALLARAGVRHISGYNQLGEEELMDRLQPESEEERNSIPLHLPYIVIVADEMADLMMTSAKEVEQHIIRLAQKSRAVGIHLVLATQKPTVDVITGLIKSNLPARIAFQVASRTDSRVVLDEMGADKLLGNGDMLFLWPGTSTLHRGQGTYVSDEEINKVIAVVGTREPQYAQELVALKPAADANDPNKFKTRDDLYEAAIEIVIREGRGSVSLLQRALGIGYGRAARLVDFMAEDGIVGQYNGSQAREILVTMEQWLVLSGQQADPNATAPPKPKRNRVKLQAPPPEPPPREIEYEEELESPAAVAEEHDEEREDESSEDVSNDENLEDAGEEVDADEAEGDEEDAFEEEESDEDVEEWLDDEEEAEADEEEGPFDADDEEPTPPARRSRSA
jgi:S-DNA-T family DNA segregation ATPase FtsK/SpoIIIE